MALTRRVLLAAAAAGAAVTALPLPAEAASAAEIDAEATLALKQLLSGNEAAAALDKEAKAIQMFPDVIKGGWEIGVGPSVVLADNGLGKKLSTTTARDGIYGFIFGQEGLMAGVGIEGSKITKFTPDP